EEPGVGGTYGEPVRVNFSAADGEDGAGVERTEFRIIENGEPGEWRVRENTAGDEPFETGFRVSTSGDYEVEFRSIDHAGNEEEIKSIDFTVDAGTCVPARSD